MTRWLWLALALSPMALAVDPYRLVLVSDAESMTKAQEFARYLRERAPFNRIPADQFEISFTTLTPDQMDCGNNTPAAPRLVTCDEDAINREKRRVGGHAAAVFTSRGSGGSGGQIAVASRDYPTSTMLHELLHVFGFADEYHYEGFEVEHYCTPPREGPNVAIITPRPPYPTKEDALGRHSRNIPWVGEIAAATPVTESQQLGTPSSYSQDIGLFEGSHCTNARGTRKIYRPYLNSIMKSLNAGVIQPLYERRILEAMEGARGAPFNLSPTARTTVVVPTSAQEAVLGPVVNEQADSGAAEEPLCPPLLPSESQTFNPQGLRDEIQHIYHHILYPRNPHEGQSNGQ